MRMKQNTNDNDDDAILYQNSISKSRIKLFITPTKSCEEQHSFLLEEENDFRPSIKATTASSGCKMFICLCINLLKRSKFGRTKTEEDCNHVTD